MHVLSFHKLHLFERSAAVIDHHAIMTLSVALLIFLGVGYALSSYSDHVGGLQFGKETEVGKPLTRLLDPQYRQEAAVRAQAITRQLEGLRTKIQVDRAYVIVYSETVAMTGQGWPEPQIARAFEVTNPGIAPVIRDLQGLAVQNWVQLERMACGGSVFSAGLPKCLGLELVTDQQQPVGYLGMEKVQQDRFSAHDFQLLQETARAIEIALVKPLEELPE